MRITPNHPRLRIIALICWACASWWIIQSSLLASLDNAVLLFLLIVLAAVVILALGIVFWLLGTDSRAGVVFDTKGLMLNLGHSAAFVTWENIAAVGVCNHHASLLSLGSTRQLGIKLHRPEDYLQSYEVRLPASRGVMGAAVRWLQGLLRPMHREEALLTLEDVARTRARSGYDVLIPEALLGGKAVSFVEMVRAYRYNYQVRHTLSLSKIPV